jgi:hypothetical protein
MAGSEPSGLKADSIEPVEVGTALGHTLTAVDRGPSGSAMRLIVASRASHSTAKPAIQRAVASSGCDCSV